MKTNYTLNRKSENLIFVNFDNGRYAKIERYNYQTLKGLVFKLKKVSGTYDKEIYDVSLNSLGGVDVIKKSTQKMNNKINHKIFGMCELLERNQNGTIIIQTEKEGKKCVIEVFFMNGIIN